MVYCLNNGFKKPNTIDSPFFLGERGGGVGGEEGKGGKLVDGGEERGERLVGRVADELIASVIMVKNNFIHNKLQTQLTFLLR